MKKRLTYLTSVIVVLLLVLALCSRNNADVPATLATDPLTNITPASETLAPSDITDTQTFREVVFHESDNQKNISETIDTQTFREATFHESDSKTATNITTENIEDVATTLVPADDSNRLTDVEIRASGCNLNTPNWGESLGIISFYTPREWEISGMGITQIWSNAVSATACQKTTFDGGTMDRNNPENSNFNADCRTNPGFPGDFFSWCAVVRFADVLCPYPWRVPTAQDFRDLDIALGGTGENRNAGWGGQDFVAVAYISRWGGVFAGCTRDGRLNPGSFNCYWSISEHNTNYAINLIYSRSGGVRPQDRHRKTHGLAVRCVR